MNEQKYFDYSLERLETVHETKLKELHRLQKKSYQTVAIKRRIDLLSTQLYYIKQAIASHRHQGRLF